MKKISSYRLISLRCPAPVPFGLTMLIALLCVAFAASAAEAEVSKFFNAAHSLTGDCSTSSDDLIPDPGCPGGTHPPDGHLVDPRAAVATDSYGNIYVANRNKSDDSGTEHVDIFDADGNYIGNVAHVVDGIAVDSTGHLYISYFTSESCCGFGYAVVRYDPTLYNGADGEIEYGSSPVKIRTVGQGASAYMSVDLRDDHFYLRLTTSAAGRIAEYGPPTNGVANTLVTESIGVGTLQVYESPEAAIDVDEVHHRIYAVDWTGTPQNSRSVVKVFKTEAPYEFVRTIDGSTVPTKQFVTAHQSLPIAVDDLSGHLFVGDINGVKKIYELEEDGGYLGTISKPTLQGGRAMAVDNSVSSPNHRYLYVPSGLAIGHLYAYEPAAEPEPVVIEDLSLSGVTEDEAVLRTTINPKGESAHWSLEYVSEQGFEEEGFAAAQVAGEGTVSPGNRGVEVFAPAMGLSPGSAYRFRVRAENQCEPGGCISEEASRFRTFAADAQAGGCANQSLRAGASAALPDCRAYELVSPGNTGGLVPFALAGGTSGPRFTTPTASPAGSSVAFAIQGGLIPGFEDGNGTFWGDYYVSRRTAAGWQTGALGPSGAQAVDTTGPGGLSSDHSFYALQVSEQGSLTNNGAAADYIRFPDGSFHLAGSGSLATIPLADTHYIAPAGSHIIFSTSGVGTFPTKVQLEPNAPPDGTTAIYDRTADGTTHVVSLLPGEVTPSPGQDANFLGTSKDGSAIAFTLNGSSRLYLRLDNMETVEPAPAGAKFGGFSAGGRYLFYMYEGDLYRFDSETQTSDALTESGDVAPVNIGAEGSGGYFLSPSVLSVEPGPRGAEPQLGGQNLYHWGGGGLDFVATVTNRDAKGVFAGTGVDYNYDGLGLWMEAEPSLRADILLSSRTSADGSALFFESRADLTGFEAAGKVELFRYDADAGSLDCISCDPTERPPSGDADISPEFGGSKLFNKFTEMPTLSENGKRAFFETPERLTVADNDNRVDVYEWEAEGEGSCAEPGGCLFLISSGQSARDNHIFGVSRTGEDVFILTGDLLVPGDVDDTPSIYDAKVGGGFVPTTGPAGECLGEACQPAAVAPNDPTPASSSFEGKGNVTEEGGAKARCPKGKRRSSNAGKSRCVPRHKKQHGKQHTRRAKTDRRAHR